MQLRVARLCLDCEELHEEQQCPVCASESYAYISRWVAAPERRRVGRRPSKPAPSTSKRRAVGYGVAGLAIAGLARLWWRAGQNVEASALSGAGELK